MKTKLGILIVIIGISGEAYTYEWFFSYDFSFGYEYIQGIGGVVLLTPLMDDPDYTGNGVFRTPFEFKIVMYKYFLADDPVLITLNSGISFYFSDHSLPNLHLSPGISVYTPWIFMPDVDVYLSWYPLYEFPLIRMKHEPLTWTLAGDLGFCIGDIGGTPLFLSIYTRVVCTLLGESGISSLINPGERPEFFPDFGVTFGVHFK
jgi:hypothetical protein